MFFNSLSVPPRVSAMYKVPSSNLFVSEPPPEWFGNGPNEPQLESWTNDNWLKSRFHFNFAEYRTGPSQFGVLRVMNDDLVQPHRAFGTHPHRDMEIVTYVVDGDLTHKDSQGNEETLGRGSVQFMSAGTGIMHSEGNPLGDQPLRFVQSWIVPRERGVAPNYGSVRACDIKDKLQRIVADRDDPTAQDVGCLVNQDVNGYAADTAKPLTFELKQGRQAYLLCVEGQQLSVSDAQTEKKILLDRHDAAELYGPLTLTFTPQQKAHLLFFEMKASPSSGRADVV